MPYNKKWSDKDVRQYKHIKESTGSKSIAAGAVNNLKKKHRKKSRARLHS